MQNQEYEINLMELTIYFCHRWKKILLCAVAGCAVQGVVNIAQCTTTPLFFALLALLWGSRGSGEDS